MKGNMKIIISMLIFGSIGIFVRGIELSSLEIAFLRAIIGSFLLIGASCFVRQNISIKGLRENMLLLILSGGAIGFNWILLFQGYRYTTISNATLSYYFAPIIVILLAPIILKERLTWVKVACICTAMLGLYLILNISGTTSKDYAHIRGIMYGLSAAVLYASVILMNKFIRNLSGFETTLTQLMMAAVVLLTTIILTSDFNFSKITYKSWILIFILGILHTGIAYYLYFSAIKDLKGQSIALLSYIDPISALVFSAIFLGEGMTFLQIMGGVLILGSTLLSEKIEGV